MDIEQSNSPNKLFGQVRTCYSLCTVDNRLINRLVNVKSLSVEYLVISFIVGDLVGPLVGLVVGKKGMMINDDIKD